MHNRLSKRPGVISLGFVIALAIAAPATAQQRRSSSDDAKDTARLIEALALRGGQVVAEIGAGSGSLSIAVARHVGEAGRVYATELGDERVDELKRAVKDAAADNIVVLAGDERVSNLPEACCDAAFMRNVYHHFADPRSMDESLFRALKPGGRLVVMDFAPRGNKEAATPSGRDEDGQHGVGAEAVASELRRAGFEVLQAENGDERAVFVVARKPAQ